MNNSPSNFESLGRLRPLSILLLWVPFLLHAQIAKGQKSDLKTKLALEAKQIGLLKDHLEEWGTITVSEPVQVLGPAFYLGNNFEFDPAKTYISNPKGSFQGGVSESLSTYLGSQSDITVAPNGTKTTATTTNSEGTQQSLSVITPNPTPVLPSPVPNPVISQREAVLIGINDKLEELILRQMANPRQTAFSQYRVDFAIVQVSVNPGWRTQQNYIADCSATCYYAKQSGELVLGGDGKRILREPAEPEDNIRTAPAPKVFSVLPLLDAQTLDLQNSQSQVYNLIFKLAAQYPSAMAQINFKQLLQFVRTYSRSAVSSTPFTRQTRRITRQTRGVTRQAWGITRQTWG